MATWITLDPGNLIPSSIEELSDACSTVGDTVATVLETSADVLDIVKNFVSGYDDALSTTVGTLQNLIADTIQQFTQNGIYLLKHAPPSFKYETSPRTWLRQVSRSLDDRYDENRPILVDPNAYVGAVVLMGTSNSFKDLYAAFGNLLRLLGMLVPSEDQIDKWPTVGELFEVVPGVGQAPDWESKRLVDYIPKLGEIADLFLDFSDSVSTAATAADIYSRFADQLRLKASTLREISTRVSELVEEITQFLGFSTVHLLPIYGQGDSEWLKDQLQNSTGGPLEDEGAEHSFGVVLLATGATSTPAELLFSLMGLSVPEV
jgi:hypothetical protein